MFRTEAFQLLALVALLAVFGAFLAWYFEPLTTGAERGAQVALTGASFSPTTPPTASPTPTPAPRAAAPYCPPGQEPEFELGFARLKEQVGEPMGVPIECEHGNPDNGDSLQQTSTGLAVYEKSTGHLRFTDGWNHWALAGETLHTWQGDARPAELR